MASIRMPARSGLALVLPQMLLCSFLWASAFLLMKIVGVALSPLALTAARGLMGGALLAAWLASRGEIPLPRGREWRDWTILGVLQGVVPNTLTAYALTEITTGLASMIQASTPLIVAVLAHGLFADERLTPRRAAGVLVGFLGMAILLGPSITGAVSGPGVLAMAATALSYALGNLYVRAIPTPQPARLAFGQQILSGLPTTAVVIALFGPSAFAGAADQALPLVVLGVFGTALPIVLYMNILKLAGPTVGSMNGYVVPVWTILLAFVALGETVEPREMLGGATVLAGIALASSGKRKPAVAPATEAV